MDRSTATFVQDAHATAIRVPVDPRTTDRAGLEAAAEDATATEELEVKLDGHPVAIRTSESSVRHVVGTAYLLGGFELVRVLDSAVRDRVRLEMLTLSQQRDGVRTFPGVAGGRLSQSAIDRDVADLKSKTLSTQRRLRTATTIQRLIADAWARIAVAEEEVLRAYEPRLISRFINLTQEAMSIARREWARYEPYDPTVSDPAPLTMTEAKERGLGRLRLRRDVTGLVDQAKLLHGLWMDYLYAAYGTGRLADLGTRGIRRASPDEDPARLFANSRKNTALRFQKFDDARAEIGVDHPAVLQVYWRIGKRATSELLTTDEEIQSWVIEALVEAVDSAQELGYDAATKPLFKPGVRVRVEPADSPVERTALPGYQQDLLERGLVVPASRVLGNRLADASDAIRSAWFQRPARLSMHRRGVEGDPFLAPYATPGRLHHAALSEVNLALQEVRRHQQERLDRALLIMDAIALPASFFTGGGSLAVAGVIHAVVRGNEMYSDVREFRVRSALAQVALTPIEQAVWEHPSAVTLTGKLLERGYQIAGDLVNHGAAGAIMDAIQISLTIAHGAEAVAEWVASDDPLPEA